MCASIPSDPPRCALMGYVRDVRHATLILALLATPALGGDKVPNVADVKLPALEEQAFRFGSGDRLQVQVYRHEDLNSDLIVAPDGTITLPLLGRLQVAGKSYEELVATIEEGLRKYYTDAAVAVNVLEVTNRKVFVVGEVGSPAVLQLTGTMHVLEALVRTGGINPDARTSNLLLVRGDPGSPAELFTIDARAMLAGDLRQNVALQPGDILVVPTKTIVNAERFFRRVQGILAPFVSASQAYRNVSIPGAGLFDDNPAD